MPHPRLTERAGAQADGTHLIEKATRTLATAAEISDRDPDSAFVLAYDAARYCGTALLAHQGLVPVEITTPADVEAAIGDARQFLGAANVLLPQLSIF